MTDIPACLSEKDTQYVRSLLDAKGFSHINETQRAFLSQTGLDQGNTLLCAETGNGKTFCAETIIKKSLNDGKSVGYLVPSVQLTNGKYDELSEWIEERYTLANSTWGEKAGYQYADVIVATFDSYFEAALRGVGNRLDVLIFDDFHELYSDFRGPTIEKCLTIAKQSDTEIFATSATIGNPDEIARWLDSELVISPAKRGVPITEKPAMKESMRKSYGTFIADLIMDHKEKGPFMVFNFQTSHAQTRALEIKDAVSFPKPDTDYRSKVQSAVDTALTNTHKDLIKCLENGVAFHYAGLENKIKKLVEDGVKSGDIKCISCTTTLAYGFDSPIQSVIVADLARFGTYIGKYEYIQWIGRAGRGGDMEEAFAFPIYSHDSAIDYFEFGTPVEEKSLESIGSHFGPVPDDYASEKYTSNAAHVSTNLSWLIIELVASGWNTLDELKEFVSLTLYGFYNHEPKTESIGSHMFPDTVCQKVEEVLNELSTQGFIDYDSKNQITTTVLGDAVFEYDHAIRMDTTPIKLKGVVEALQDAHPISPEQLIEEFAAVFYRCDLRETVDKAGTFAELLEKHDIGSQEAGVTAGVISWLWCQGIKLDDIENLLTIDVSHLPSVARHLSQAVSAVHHLYDATSYKEPDWIETFAKQLENGVTVDDLHLTARDGIARGRVVALEDQIQIAWSNLDPDMRLEESAPTIEKLAFQKNTSPTNFEERIVRRADHISTGTAPTVVEAVDDWVDGSYTQRPSPPISESGREFIRFGNKGEITRSQRGNRQTRTTETPSSRQDDGTRSTALDDFL